MSPIRLITGISRKSYIRGVGQPVDGRPGLPLLHLNSTRTFVTVCPLLLHRSLFVGYFGGIMSGFVWLLLAGVAIIWLASTAIVATIGIAAHRGDPRVVIPDPYETPSHPLAWDRLREVVLQENADLARERADFTTWEREVRGRRSGRAA
jgi:hypothetical protein